MNRTSLLFSLLLAPLVLCSAGCSAGSSSSPNHTADGTASSADGSDNGCAPANNPEGCPAHYSHSEDFGECQIGVECQYPGYSDDSPSCGDYAVLDCRATDGGSTWVATQ